MNSNRFRPLAPDHFPGVDLDPVAAWKPLFESELPVAGGAWRDAEFQAELRASHERWGASRESLAHLAALGDGSAGCVITGQQPGLLGGPLYTVYKAAGAIGLARALGERSGRTVVPVFWCGADDSDFDELRGGWLWGPDGAARAELPREMLPLGERVGSLRDDRIESIEREALGHVMHAAGREAAHAFLDSLPAGLDFGERASARLLKLFAGEGLVVVDARSPRLRALGRPLFERYAAGHTALTDALLERRRQLVAAGAQPPIAEDALRSALFVLDGESRRKIDPADLARAVAGDEFELATAVSLRPVWQDSLLGPVATILGPSELAYHAQLEPLFAGLDVRRAVRLPRPHLLLLPHGLEEALDSGVRPEILTELLRDQVSARELLQRSALEASARESLEGLGRRLEDAYATAGELLDGRTVAASHERAQTELKRLEGELAAVAMASRHSGGMAWQEIPRFLFPRGRPQERVFSADLGHALYGGGWAAFLGDLAAASARSYERGGLPAFAASFELTGD